MKLIDLESKRLVLRQLELNDAADVFAFTSDKSITQFLSWEPHQSIERTQKFLDYMISTYPKKESASQWAIWLKEANKVIGITGYISYEPEHDRAEIAYLMSNKYAGKGLMTEANQLVLEHAFNHLNLNRVQAKAELDNLGSQSVLKKLGFELEGVFKDFLKIKGTYRTYKYYAILK